jgi:hypothetical protein
MHENLKQQDARLQALFAHRMENSRTPDETATQQTLSNNGLVLDMHQTKAFHHNGHILFDSSKLTAISAVGIRTAQFPRSVCKPWCSCVCHERGQIRTPHFLERIIGSLFIGYSGLPILTKPCNQTSCHLRAQPTSTVTYFFPQWFMSRALSLTMASTPLAGPVMSLKVHRMVPGDAAIFDYAMSGDVERMKSLFLNGLASPHDVSMQSGVTPLHVCS